MNVAIKEEHNGEVSVWFFCPGCNGRHRVITASPTGYVWAWNNNLERPTFTPSVLVTSPANPNAVEEFKEYRTERRCHSFVRYGQIEFLSDCTHSLAGQTVPLQPIE